MLSWVRLDTRRGISPGIEVFEAPRCMILASVVFGHSNQEEGHVFRRFCASYVCRAVRKTTTRKPAHECLPRSSGALPFTRLNIFNDTSKELQSGRF